MVHLGARRHRTRQGRRAVGRMRIGRTGRAQALADGLGGAKDSCWPREGALRDRKTRLNLRLGNGRQHGVYVSMSTLLNCVVCMCMFCVPSKDTQTSSVAYHFRSMVPSS
jgi:hypothetical protein